MYRVILAAALPLLGACATAVSGSPSPAGENTAENRVCRNEMLEQFKGRPASEELAREILRVSGAKTLQWIEKGMMVTMDFREDRVRVWLDAQNRVERVNCG